MAEKLGAPRGTQDILPPESGRWSSLEAHIRALASRYGYGEIRTPLFESTELFVRGVGETTDIVEKEMYTFADRGDRSLTLRPEWTAPVVRAVLEHGLLTAGPQRLYYLGPIFRYERPQKGRYRQSHQFGVECFGFAGPEADCEVISLAWDLVRGYRISDAALNINSHRGRGLPAAVSRGALGALSPASGGDERRRTPPRRAQSAAPARQ